jgi:hypothetical protein
MEVSRMSERKYSIDNDLKEAQKMVEALEPYVYQNQLYMPISGGGIFSPMPALTIGAALLRLRRLRALHDQLSASQQATVGALADHNDKVWAEWRVHYEKKLVEEANSRLKLMSSYIQDCKEDARACASNYPAEALRRTIVQEIIVFMDEQNIHSAEIDRGAARVDSAWRNYVKPGGFLWAPVLEPVYPKEPFWWLYSEPNA